MVQQIIETEIPQNHRSVFDLIAEVLTRLEEEKKERDAFLAPFLLEKKEEEKSPERE